MQALTSLVTKERVAIAGDACLVTAAAFGLVNGAVALAFDQGGEETQSLEWAQYLSSVLTLAVAILGPVLAWRLHGRAVTVTAVLGGVVGAFVGSLVVMVLAMLSAAVGWVASWVTSSELAGPIAILVLVSAAFLALVGWLVADAVRDLAPSRRAHVQLDVVRVVSAAALVLLALGVALWQVWHPGDESSEAIIFAMASGVSGAMSATGAQVATGLAARGKTSAGATSS